MLCQFGYNAGDCIFFYPVVAGMDSACIKTIKRHFIHVCDIYPHGSDI